MLAYLLVPVSARQQHTAATKIQIYLARYFGAWTLAIAGLFAVVHNSSSFAPFLASGALLIILALAMAALSESWESRASVLTGPWISGLLILLPPTLYRQVNLPPRLSLLLALLSAVGLAAVRILWHTFSLPIASGYSPRRRLALIPAGIALAALCVFGISSSREVTQDRAAKLLAGTAKTPNVVLIVMDTVRGDHTSLLGYARDTTPQLRAFAGAATSFTNAYAVSDMTLATHATMFTGLYPRQHGAYCGGTESDRGRSLRPSFDTLAEVLAHKGYATMAAAANTIYLRPEWGLDQGFQVFDLPDPIPTKQYTMGIRDLIRAALRRFMDVRDYDAQFQSAERINRDVLHMMSAAERKGSSFFLFVNYMDAHEPYLSKDPFDRRFGKPDSAWSDENYLFLKQDFRLKHIKVPARTVNLLTTLYDSSIAYEDDQIGNLIRELKERNLYDNSLIIVTADHGEGLGESKVLSHPGSVYQDHIRIPLIVKYPQQRESAVVEQHVSQIDILPTILAAAGLGAPPNLPGADLHGVEQNPSRDLLSVSYPCLANTVPDLNRTMTALISARLKYIESTNGRRELYDLSQDPLELANIVNGSPERTALAASLARMGKIIVPDRRIGSQNDPDSMRRLRGLGYVQ